MSARASASTGRRYGLARVCRAWKVARSTVYASRSRREAQPAPRRRGPTGGHTDGELIESIRADLDASPFLGEGHRKVWARLRFGGMRTSKRRVLRLMRENGLLAPSRVGRRRGPRSHDGKITTERPDEMWGTDMTTTVTLEEGLAHVFIAIDHCTDECVGIHAAASGNRFEALEPIRQGVREVFGAFEAGAAKGLSARHDHGSQYMSHDFQAEIAFLGIESSPAFVRAPEGNGCAEWFIRVLKENLLWVRSFSNIEELRTALLVFKRRYNEKWILERHGYKTPSQVRQDFLAGQEIAA